MQTPHNTLGRTLKLTACALLLFAASAGNALAWGPGLHAYIADVIAKKAGWKNVNEMYGGMAPDVVNYMFNSPDLSQMYIATHFDFESMWDGARTPQERTLAQGFLMHNGLWGADYSAHTASLSLADHTQGYVIQKAQLLAGMLSNDPGYQSLHIPEVVTLEICHTMIENSVELLMAQVDRKIGQKVVLACSKRSDVFPYLLARVYSPMFEQYFDSRTQAAEALVGAEEIFRQITIMQGETLQNEFPVALDQMADLNAQLALGFLAQYGIVLPPGVDVKGLINSLISAGCWLCAGDFYGEVLATTRAVEKNMSRNGHRFPQY
jgi:hypothetical protein